jgi:hypothetical protein
MTGQKDLVEQESYNRGAHIIGSTDTLSSLGRVGAALPDVAGGSVLALRLSDILPDARPDPYTGKITLPPVNEFEATLRQYFDENGITGYQSEMPDLLNALNREEGTDYRALPTSALKFNGEDVTGIIFTPEQPATMEEELSGLAQNAGLRARENFVYDPLTDHALSLLHEAGHLKSASVLPTNFMTPALALVSESAADNTAYSALEDLERRGIVYADRATVQFFKDTRSLAPLYSPMLSDEAGYTHDTGVLQKAPEIAELSSNRFAAVGAGVDHMQAISQINGTVYYLLSQAARPSMDSIVNSMNDPELTTAYRSVRNNEPYKDEYSEALRGVPHQPGFEVDLRPAIINAAAQSEANGGAEVYEMTQSSDIVVGRIVAAARPELHYALVKSLYESGIFQDEPLQQEYAANFIEAYERQIGATRNDRRLVDDLRNSVETLQSAYEDDQAADTPATPASRTAPISGPQT